MEAEVSRLQEEITGLMLQQDSTEQRTRELQPVLNARDSAIEENVQLKLQMARMIAKQQDVLMAGAWVRVSLCMSKMLAAAAAQQKTHELKEQLAAMKQQRNIAIDQVARMEHQRCERQTVNQPNKAALGNKLPSDDARNWQQWEQWRRREEKAIAEQRCEEIYALEERVGTLQHDLEIKATTLQRSRVENETLEESLAAAREVILGSEFGSMFGMQPGSNTDDLLALLSP